MTEEINLTIDTYFYGKGKGLMAKRHIKPGEVVLIDNPIVTGHDESTILSNVLISDESQKLIENFCSISYEDLDEQHKKKLNDVIFSATETYSFFTEQSEMTDLELATKAWKYALKLECNSFNLWDQNYERIGMGVYKNASKLNHSCIPNLVREQHGKTLVFSALAHIYTGNELTFSYVPVTYYRECRRNLLYKYFQFNCQCERCNGSSQMDMVLTDTLGHKPCGGSWTSYGVCAICGKTKRI